MSIDKFGRRKRGAKATPGPKGVGFKLTPDGQYDMEDKRLVNVADPVQDKDAVNVKTLRSASAIFMQSKDGVYNANSKKIINVKDPSSANDAANKKYVDSKTPELGKEAWAFKRRRLGHVADPKFDGEAVTLGYLKANTLTKAANSFNANNTIITNLGQPVAESDAVTKSYFDKNALLISSSVPRRLSNIDRPTEPNDAVNLDYLNGNVLVKANTTDWDARWGKIKYLSNPAGPNDAATKAYVQECVADMSYAIYSELMTMKNNQRVEYSMWMSKAFTYTWGAMFKLHK